jgi:uncharacterized protein (DUF2147 family)
MIGQRKVLAASGLAVLLAMPVAMAGTDSALTGNWARDDGAVRMKISTCGSNLCAVNTWVKDPNGKEKVGDELVMTLQPVAGSKFDGQAYDVRRQAHYKITITLAGNSLQSSGCVLLGIVCKSVGWTRMD